MGILCSDLRDQIIRPTLKDLKLWSESAENLLLGTAAQESLMGRYLRQVKGPALGIFQMEPATHFDIWKNFLSFRRLYIDDLYEVTRAAGKPEEMVWNLRYATAMARYHYLRVEEPLPGPADIHGLGGYWKEHYNTIKGAGTVEEFVKNYNELVEP